MRGPPSGRLPGSQGSTLVRPVQVPTHPGRPSTRSGAPGPVHCPTNEDPQPYRSGDRGPGHVDPSTGRSGPPESRSRTTSLHRPPPYNSEVSGIWDRVTRCPCWSPWLSGPSFTSTSYRPVEGGPAGPRDPTGTRLLRDVSPTFCSSWGAPPGTGHTSRVGGGAGQRPKRTRNVSGGRDGQRGGLRKDGQGSSGLTQDHDGTRHPKLFLILS